MARVTIYKRQDFDDALEAFMRKVKVEGIMQEHQQRKAFKTKREKEHNKMIHKKQRQG